MKHRIIAALALLINISILPWYIKMVDRLMDRGHHFFGCKWTGTEWQDVHPHMVWQMCIVVFAFLAEFAIIGSCLNVIFSNFETPSYGKDS